MIRTFLKDCFVDRAEPEKQLIKLPMDSADLTVVQEFYNKTPFPNYEDHDDLSSLLSKFGENEFLQQLKRELGYNKNIIEVGCGTAQLSIALAAGTNNNVVAFDPTQNSIALGHEFALANSLENIFFVNGDLFDDPFKPETFDLVWCSGVLHHTKDAKGGFQLIQNWAKPGGLVIIGLYNRYGRLKTNFLQFLYRVSLKSKLVKALIFYLDPVLSGKTSNAQKDAWFFDQYDHPLETSHTIDEVIDWFQEENIEFLGSMPDSDFEGFFIGLDAMTGNKGTWFTRFAAQLSMLFGRHRHEGGLFIVIGRRPI